MNTEYFLTISSAGEPRKLLKIREPNNKKYSQLTAYLGRGFGNFGKPNVDRLAAYKYSIHWPRGDSDEHVIHFKAEKYGEQGEWLNHRHYTRALTGKKTFAHVFSGRYQTLRPIHNVVEADRGQIIQIPEELDPDSCILTVGVYVGNKDVAFEIPAGEHVKMVRIETAYLSFIVLYMIEQYYPTLRFSQIFVTVTLPPEKIENPSELSIHEKIKDGCTPEFSVNHFVIQHFDLCRDYWITWMQEVEEHWQAGELTDAQVEETRNMVMERMLMIDLAEEKRKQEGKLGRYLPAQPD